MSISYNKYHEQTVDVYRKVDYGGNSIYNSGCGPSSLANALMVLGIADITVKNACAFALSCGARIKGAGTDMHTLLSAATKKWKITYTTTSSNSKLAAHLRSGGVAIMNQGSSYKVFSNGGHFVVAAAIDNNNNVTVIDSYWNRNKYRTWPAYHTKSKILSRCFVRTPLEWCGKATIDRFPSYYLISKVEQKQDNKNTQSEIAKEDDDIIMYKTIDDVPVWGKNTVQKLIDKGYLTGSGNANGKIIVNLTESMLRSFVVNDRAGLYDK